MWLNVIINVNSTFSHVGTVSITASEIRLFSPVHRAMVLYGDGPGLIPSQGMVFKERTHIHCILIGLFKLYELKISSHSSGAISFNLSIWN